VNAEAFNAVKHVPDATDDLPPVGHRTVDIAGEDVANEARNVTNAAPDAVAEIEKIFQQTHDSLLLC
jgi:hypothetical protein